MAEEFVKAGLKAAYIVSDGGSESRLEREQVKQKLARHELNFAFVVDIFNEGVDIPEIDTVLFLRPTESLTIFLQQLGRGLRLSDGKDCLTVLDYVSQAHAKYNFADKFRALVGKSNNSIGDEIEKGFPHLPAGCSIQLEKQAKEYILNNIESAIFDARRLRREIESFERNTHQELTLLNFLEHHSLGIKTIYKGANYWTKLLAEAGKVKLENEERCKQIASGIRRLLHIDSVAYLDFIQGLIDNRFVFKPRKADPIAHQFALMFYYDVWQKGINELGFASLAEGIAEIAKYPLMASEIKQVIEVLRARINFVPKPIALDYPLGLELHAQYSRDELLAAFGKSTAEKISTSREGVVDVPELNTELLLVTLNKSDKDFSPSTQYEDYAISEKIFHWQSQNKTAPATSVGQSYIHHKTKGRTILLFVRDQKKDEYGFTSPYHFLGPVDYKDHSGAKPMNITWELHEPMPGYLLGGAMKMG
jgi:hypothetical protein